MITALRTTHMADGTPTEITPKTRAEAEAGKSILTNLGEIIIVMKDLHPNNINHKSIMFLLKPSLI